MESEQSNIVNSESIQSEIECDNSNQNTNNHENYQSSPNYVVPNTINDNTSYHPLLELMKMEDQQLILDTLIAFCGCDQIGVDENGVPIYDVVDQGEVFGPAMEVFAYCCGKNYKDIIKWYTNNFVLLQVSYDNNFCLNECIKENNFIASKSEIIKMICKHASFEPSEEILLMMYKEKRELLKEILPKVILPSALSKYRYTLLYYVNNEKQIYYDDLIKNSNSDNTNYQYYHMIRDSHLELNPDDNIVISIDDNVSMTHSTNNIESNDDVSMTPSTNNLESNDDTSMTSSTNNLELNDDVSMTSLTNLALNDDVSITISTNNLEPENDNLESENNNLESENNDLEPENNINGDDITEDDINEDVTMDVCDPDLVATETSTNNDINRYDIIEDEILTISDSYLRADETFTDIDENDIAVHNDVRFTLDNDLESENIVSNQACCEPPPMNAIIHGRG